MLFIGFIVYLNRPKPEQYFKTIQLSTTNTIYNETDMDYLDTIVDVGIRELKLDNIEVEIRPMDIMIQDKFNTNNTNNTLKAFIVKLSENNYMVYSSRISREEALTMLSHELIHLKQYYDGRLKIQDSSHVLWNNRDIIDLINVEYNDRPWEREAYDNQKDMEVRIRKVLY